MFLAESNKTGMKFHDHLPVGDSFREFALDRLAEFGHGSILLLGDDREGAGRRYRLAPELANRRWPCGCVLFWVGP